MSPENKPSSKNWLIAVPIVAASELLIYCLLQLRLNGSLSLLIFYFVNMYVSYVPLLALAICFILCLRYKDFSLKNVAGLFVLLILTQTSSLIFTPYPSTFDSRPSEVSFHLPMDSIVQITWGGATEEVNYHVIDPGQRWAYDILMMKDGKSYLGDSSKLSSYYCYGKSLIAPAAGEIVETFNTEAETPVNGSNEDNPAGNYVIIKVAENQYLFACHMQPGSITVKPGESVKQGQKLGLVGNSGNSSEPHVHIHLQSTEDLDFGEGIPMPFSNYVMNGKLIEKGIPIGGFDRNDEFIGQTVRNGQY